MRLDQLLKEAGFGGRNQIKKLIRSKQVSVDGDICQKESQIVDSHLQEILVTGKKVAVTPHAYYMLNKPNGVVSACRDDEHQTVIDLISTKDQRPGLYPVGRLDRDTEGLVLLTDNGPLGFRMLHPRYHVEKVYEVEVNGLLKEDAIQQFQEGIQFLDGTICKPATLDILEAGEDCSRARITLSEGKFHQVKKMFLAYGVKVTYLKRISFGPFQLEASLKRGHYRPLTESEIGLLKQFFD